MNQLMYFGGLGVTPLAMAKKRADDLPTNKQTRSAAAPLQVFKSYLLLKTLVCLLFATLMSVLWLLLMTAAG